MVSHFTSFSRFFLIKISYSCIITYFAYFRCFLYFFIVLLRLIWCIYPHLPLIMSLDTFYRLSQCICSSMLMIWMLKSMLMKQNQRFILRILCIMQIPIMTGVPALYCYILPIKHNHIKILLVYLR